MQLFSSDILILFLLLGSVAGVLAGLLGIGGGIILIPLFLWAFKVAGFAPDVIVHAAFATSLAIIIPTAISSTFGHRKRGNVAWHHVPWLAGGGVLGVVAGSSLAAALPGEILKGLFGLMQIGVGLKMFFYHPRLPPEDTAAISPRKLLPVGFVVGGFSSFFGVGGGIVAVPMMVIALRYPIHLAVGSSSALMVVSSVCGTLSYIAHGWNMADLPPFSLGYVNALVALMIAPLTIVFARLGIRIASRASQDMLMRIFAGFIILVGLQMASQLIWTLL